MKEHNSIEDLILENEALEVRNEFLEKCVKALKLNNAKVTTERNELLEENRCLKNKLNNVTLWDLSPEAQEEAGHALARSLLGGA